MASLSKLNQKQNLFITVLEVILIIQLLQNRFINVRSHILAKAIIAIVTVGAESALIVHLTATEIPITLINLSADIHDHILLVGRGRGHDLHRMKDTVLAGAGGIHTAVTLMKTIDIVVDIPDRDLSAGADPELVPDHTVGQDDTVHTRVNITGLIQAVVADPEVDLHQEVGVGLILIHDHTPNRRLIPDPDLGRGPTTNLTLALDHRINLPSRSTDTRTVLIVLVVVVDIIQKRIPNMHLGVREKMKRVEN